MRHPKELRNKTFEDYLKTGSVKDAAEMNNLPLETVKKWHARDNWAEKLANNVRQVSDGIMVHMAKKKIKKELSVLEKSRELQAWLKQKALEEGMIEDMTDATQFARAISPLLTIEGKITQELIERTKSDHTVDFAKEFKKYRQEKKKYRQEKKKD